MDPEKPLLDGGAGNANPPGRASHDTYDNKPRLPPASTWSPYPTVPGTHQETIHYPEITVLNHQPYAQPAAYQAPSAPATMEGAEWNIGVNNHGDALQNHQQHPQPHSPPVIQINDVQQPGQCPSGSNTTTAPSCPSQDEDFYKREKRAQIKIEEKSLFEAYLLCLPLGFLGLHHFYLGRLGVGFLYFFTLGLFGIGWIVDWFRLPSLVRQTNRKIREDADRGYKLYGGPYDELNERSVWTAYLFWLPPIGLIGGHHYYLGRIGYGIVYTLTFGLFGVGWLFDFCRMGVLTRRANKDIRTLRSWGTVSDSPYERMYLDDAYILAFPLGFLGLHHFYMRRWVFGITYFLTMGCMGVGFVVDLFRLPCIFERTKREMIENKPKFHIDDAYLMWFPLGLLGLHHFYLHRMGWGTAYFLTFGILGIGWLVDFYRIPFLVRNANTRREHSILNDDRGAESRRTDYGAQGTPYQNAQAGNPTAQGPYQNAQAGNPTTQGVHVTAYAYPLDAFGNPIWTQGVAWNGQGVANPPLQIRTRTDNDPQEPSIPYSQLFPNSHAQGGVIKGGVIN